jgi:hypothetical protein
MMVMSFIVGVVSVVSSYYWWTKDWWQPHTVIGTIVGIEDFIMGFAVGGIMAGIYEVIFRRKYTLGERTFLAPKGIIILLTLSQITTWLVWGVGTTTFVASVIAMLLAASVMFYYRKDLIINGLWSGVLMVVISLLFYGTIILIYPLWVEETYLFQNLSGIRALGFPIEEFVFWFLAGVVWGPLFEYWHNEHERRHG